MDDFSWNDYPVQEKAEEQFNWDEYPTVKEPEKGLGERFVDSTVDALPALGGMTGGTLGLAGGPAGAIAGAGAGAYLGKAAQNLIRPPKNSLDYLTEPVMEGAKGAGYQLVGDKLAGPIINKALTKAKPVSDYISNRLKSVSQPLAARALGPFVAQHKQYKGRMNDIGQEALDSKVIGWIPRSISKIEERAVNASQGTGQALEDLTEELSYLELHAIKSGIPRDQIAKNLRNKMISPNSAGIPSVADRNNYFSQKIDNFLQNGPRHLKFKDLRSGKIELNKGINYKRLNHETIPPKEKFDRALASEFKSGEEHGADAIEKAYYGQSSNRIQNLKKKYGNQESAQKILANKVAHQKSNQIVGLKDAIMSVKGLPYAIANKIIREYGSQVSSKTIDTLASMLEKSPMLGSMLEKNSGLLLQVIGNIEKHQNKQ